MILLQLKKRNMSKGKICKDCKRVIDNVKIKGMRCSDCGALICYKCNMAYKCNDCYTNLRIDYYEDKAVLSNV